MALRRYQDGSAPWYTPELYTVTINPGDKRCIAPTTEGRRCRNMIEGRDLDSITALQGRVCRSTDVYEIVQKTRDLVLARCCTRTTHREKLDTDDECRRLIAEKFIDKFSIRRQLQVNVPRELLLVSLNNESAYRLIPYVQDEDESFISVLKSGIIPSDQSPHFGLVYAFTTTSYPGIVKIGFTSKSWEDRKFWLETCMEDPQLVAKMEVDYPERMEKLIHLELQAHRRRIIRCRQCDRGHIEFFETTAATVQIVFEDWHAVLANGELYVANCLSGSWAQRIQRTTVLDSVAMLLQLVEQERVRRLAEMRDEIDSLMLRVERLQVAAMSTAQKADLGPTSASYNQAVGLLTPQGQGTGQSKYNYYAAGPTETPYGQMLSFVQGKRGPTTGNDGLSSYHQAAASSSSPRQALRSPQDRTSSSALNRTDFSYKTAVVAASPYSQALVSGIENMSRLNLGSTEQSTNNHLSAASGVPKLEYNGAGSPEGSVLLTAAAVQQPFIRSQAQSHLGDRTQVCAAARAQHAGQGLVPAQTWVPNQYAYRSQVKQQDYYFTPQTYSLTTQQSQYIPQSQYYHSGRQDTYAATPPPPPLQQSSSSLRPPYREPDHLRPFPAVPLYATAPQQPQYSQHPLSQTYESRKDSRAAMGGETPALNTATRY